MTLVANLEDISDVKQGIATGDNKFYLYKKNGSFGKYKIIDEKLALNEKEVKKIIENKNLRTKIIENGISQEMFNGKTIVPLDKGGSSDIEKGRLGNYFSLPEYYIDWSEQNVNRLKTLTMADVKRYYGINDLNDSDERRIASRLQNVEYYFREGITFSPTGIYAPIFKVASGAVFDHAGDCIFVKKPFEFFFSNELLLGILCSKIIRYIQKSFLNNSVSVQVDDIKKTPIPICSNKQKMLIEKLVTAIISKQHEDPNYPYQKNEQIELDEILYNSFGLDSNLIDEVENWYDRKYPKLSF